MGIPRAPGRAPGFVTIHALCLQALAFWPVWRWYVLRLRDSGDEPWGVVALLGAAWVMLAYRRSPGAPGPEAAAGASIGWAPVFATLAYAAAYPFLAPLPRAIMALAAVGCLLPSLGLPRVRALHASGFLLLSLPVIPSLQFYLGYPLRIATGEASAMLINLAGFPAVRDGALLAWRDHVVFIDAPCSGIKMLWAMMVAAHFLAVLRGYGPLGTSAMAAAAVAAAVSGNIMRTTSLFFLETGVVRGPAWAHSALGVTAFLASGCLVVWAGKARMSDALPFPGGPAACVR